MKTVSYDGVEFNLYVSREEDEIWVKVQARDLQVPQGKRQPVGMVKDWHRLYED